MYASQRREEIYELMLKKHFLSVAYLSNLYHVSEVTIRNDLRRLEQEGKVERNYGGARLKEWPDPPTFSESLILQYEAKQSIVEKAVQFIRPGDSIFLDASTTTLLLAQKVAQIEGITVVSNSIPVFEVLKEYQKGTLIGVPGTLNPATQSFVGPFAEQMLSNLRVNKAFITPKGILPEGLRDQIIIEATIRKKAIDIADEVIVLADHSKFATNDYLVSIDRFDGVRV